MTDLLKTWQIHCSTKQNLTHLILPLGKAPLGAGGPRGPQEAAGIPQKPHQTGHCGIQTLWHIPDQSLAWPLKRSAVTEISKYSWEGFGFTLKGINPLLHTSKGVFPCLTQGW